MTGITPRQMTAALFLLATSLAAAAEVDYQVHGFAAQSFASSEGNNVLGESTEGSFEFYEAGLNGTVALPHRVLISAQALVRDAGETDNEGLRLDYALVDYQFLSTPTLHAGLRAGRVKNSFGLFNESRDVIFTRPSITLPQAVYIENQGFRRILFSSDGGQLYGGINHGDYDYSLNLAVSADRDANDDEKRLLLPPGVDGEVQFEDFWVARLLSESLDGGWRYGVSYLQAQLGITAEPGIPYEAQARFQLYVLSLSRNTERTTITAEAQLMSTKGRATGVGDISGKGDGAYVQLDYRLTPNWELYGRYDLSFSNRDDRSGRKYAAATGADRHSQFAKDSMLGLRWLPDAHWGVWAEMHLIDGTSSVPAADNRGRTLEPHWNCALLMAAYRF